MVVDSSADLLAEAEAAYSRVVLDPAGYVGNATEMVDRARAAGDHPALVVALRALAWARHAVLDNAGAKRLLDEAVRLAQRHGLDRRLGDVLVTRAVALMELGLFAAAARDLRRAEPLVAPAQRPDLRMQQAIIDHNAGRVVSAVALYRSVLTDPLCPTVIWVKAANNLSIAHTQLGNPKAALEYLDRAAVLARELSPLLFAVITNSQAWSSFHAGRITESVRRFEEAGRLYAAAGAPLGEHYLDYADALVDLRLLDEATAVAQAAAGEFDRNGARLMAAEARLRCAGLELALGDVKAAQDDAEAAVRDLQGQRRTAWVARAAVTAVEAGAASDGYTAGALRRLRQAALTLQRLGLRAGAVEAHLAAGRAALALGRTARVREHLGAAGDLADGQSLLVRLRGRLASALLAGADGSPAAVIRHCRAGLTDLARHRAALPSVELRVLAAGNGAELGNLGLRTLLPATPTAGRVAPAGRILTWLERTRAASLLTVQAPVAEVEEDVIALRAVQHDLRAARREHGHEPRDLVARQAALEARIRRRSWAREGTAGEVADVVSVAELRRLLDGAWLVEYAAVDDRVLAVVVEPSRTRLVEAASLREVERETDALLFALRRLLRGGRFAAAARESADDAVATLSRLLIQPLRAPDDAPLVVVPSGPFFRVLWSPLRAGPVCVAPSATFWARSAAAGPASAGAASAGAAPAMAALVAGPGLPGAVEEVRALRPLHPTATALVPPESTVEATAELMHRADLVHLACHGHLRSDNPLFSALELSDGPLTLYEMFARGLAPRRVILAACDSGVERSYEGDEVLGFVSALMARGAAGVVASGVPVPDGACVVAMTALHERLARGAPLVTALHEARSAIGSGTAAEYVAWCGLTAYGFG
jgi:tetratricopeptide (TPR) repeat protein